MRWSIGLLEDNPQIAELLTIALGDECTVTVYDTGAAFLRALFPGSEVAPPFAHDLVILDLMLPDMPGIDVITAIRERHDISAAQLPILVLTGSSQLAIAQVVARFPGVPIVRKPFHLDELPQAIESLMAVPTMVEHLLQQRENQSSHL